MTSEQKTKYLASASSALNSVRSLISNDLDGYDQRIEVLKELSQASSASRLTYETLRQMENVKHNHLQQLYPSPYFHQCRVKFESESDEKELFFGKFPYLEVNIYSWVSPAATIRFEKPGQFAYKVDRGRIQKGDLLQKDQYLIIDGKIIFLATEKAGQERELIHQEYFSTRKTGFVLPEIVAQMEKAQDEVIRAGYSGPLVITGPAGSGKTTLALHRVAYLLQSPDTAQLFAPEEIIVFVQDEGTKNYFSRLLPDLGISNVEITTFGEWAMKILGLSGYRFKNRFFEDDDYQIEERFNDLYERHKLSAVNGDTAAWQKSIFSTLNAAYGRYFDETQKKILADQEKQKVLDRLDLTVLLQCKQAHLGRLAVDKEYYQVKKNGEMEKKQRTVDLKYKLMIVDEFQNYLPRQLQIFDRCLNELTRSSLYVGDLRQCIQLGTIKDWRQLPVGISDRRLITVQKVYRNTKEILKYLRKMGYSVDIPDQLKDGDPVEELAMDEAGESAFIEKMLKQLEDFSVGIIAKNRKYLQKYGEKFSGHKNVRVLTMPEAQGVEFDTVFIVGIKKNDFAVDCGNDDELAREKKKIISDLLYISLTRAMTKMYIIGRERLSDFAGEVVVS